MADSEDDLVVRHVVGRLVETHPRLDPQVVETAVQTAYEELRYARVRTYLPMLIERRAKDLLPPGDQPPAP
ncbi:MULTISPECIES: three-helix bundle dimerization domain-containing protein [unclassified Streptomyces]|uniref:three-helix bundle dimerization domain-containing protein n=1 Tax=unclassified Streptomyces TaxID=2593676 RepID=UPI00365A9F61